MTQDAAARAACTTWLARVLFPLALEAAGLAPTTSITEVLALRRPRIPVYEELADDACEALTIVAAARAVAHWAREDAAYAARDAIVWLAMEAAYERAITRDLCAELGPEPLDIAARAEAAEDAFDRWPALAPAVASAMQELLFTVADAVRD